MKHPNSKSMKLLGLDTFPILGWASLPESLTRPEVFETIRDCGINTFMTVGIGGGACGPAGDITPIMKQLDLAAAVGIKALVCDKRFNPLKNPPTDWKATVDSALADYAGHPGVGGYYVFDEPVVNDSSGRAGIEDMVDMMTYLQQKAPDRIAYVNALGFGARGRNCFAEYIDDYTRLLAPQFISTDCYSLTTHPGHTLPGYFEDDCGFEVPELGGYYREAYWEGWEEQLRVAKRYNKPLWGFVLAVPHSHAHWFYGPVTEGTIRMEVFTALAYGAEAIQYFAMPTITGNTYYDDAILTPEGEPSIRYSLFKKVNRSLQVYGSVMVGLEVDAVYYHGYVPSGCKRFRRGRWGGDSSHRPLAGVDGEQLILSFMRDGVGGQYLFVVNNHPVNRNRVQLHLESEWTASEMNPHDGSFGTPGTYSQPGGNHWRSNFEPGQGRLFRLIPPSTGPKDEFLAEV